MTAGISLRRWNRTFLTRQHLLERVDEDAIEVLDRCVGMQSQDPHAAFFGLFSRIADFDPSELDDLLTGREVVRMALLRGTVFLVDAEDARWMRPLAEPVLRRGLASNAPTLTAEQIGAVLHHAVELLAGRQLPGAELGSALAQRFPEVKPTSLVALARCGLPLVQVPPRGLWRGRGAPTYSLFDDWVGAGDPAVADEEATAELIRLYLRGFGPATVAGIQAWSGLTRLQSVVEKLEADWELVRLTGPHGETLYDLDGLGLADPDLPAPARLIAPYDHVLFTGGDRIRVADPELYRATMTPNGRSPGFCIVDGFLAGTWHLDVSGIPVVEPIRELTAAERHDLDEEVERLRGFLAAHPRHDHDGS